MDRPDLNRTRPAGETETADASDAAGPRDWVDELIEMTRPGLDMELPDRAFLSRVPTFVFDDFS